MIMEGASLYLPFVILLMQCKWEKAMYSFKPVLLYLLFIDMSLQPTGMQLKMQVFLVF